LLNIHALIEKQVLDPLQTKTPSRLCHQENGEGFLHLKLIVLLRNLTNFLGQLNQKGK